jgi:hypothetical protein
LKHDVQDDTRGKQIADRRTSLRKKLSLTSSMEEQPKKVRRISRFGISEASTDEA